jgi:hypothetical protein
MGVNMIFAAEYFGFPNPLRLVLRTQPRSDDTLD